MLFRSQEELDLLRRRREHYEKTREHAIDQAKLEAKRIIEQARFTYEQAEQAALELKKKMDSEELSRTIVETKSRVRSELKKAEGRAERSGLKRPADNAVGKKLEVGDSVMLLSSNKPATVITKPDENGDMTIQAGILKISVNKRDVRLAGVEKDKTEFRGGMHMVRDIKNVGVKTELDIRGFDSEQAIMELEKFIDDALVTGLATVTVIHGKGTGTLRAAVHTRLKGMKYVKNYRLGSFGEGETGVTIVEL